MPNSPISKGWKRVQSRVYSNGKSKFYTQVNSYLNVKMKRVYFDAINDAITHANDTVGGVKIDGWYRLDEGIATNDEQYLVSVQAAKVREFVNSMEEAYSLREEAFTKSLRKASKYTLDERTKPYNGQNRMMLFPSSKICNVEKQSKRGKTFLTWYEGSRYVSTDVTIKNEDDVTLLMQTAKQTCNKPTDAISIHQDDLTEFHEKYYRFKHTPLELPYREVPFDPYFLGLWLGDGDSARVCITNIDTPITEYVQNFAQSLGLRVSIIKKPGYDGTPRAFGYNIVNDPGRGNSLLKAMQDLSLIKNKHIPEIYINNTQEVRAKVLAGLIDSDGYLSGNQYEIHQKNIQLSKDIVKLARSLGFYTVSKESEKSCMHNGEKRTGIYQRMSIHIDRLTPALPLLLERRRFHPGEIKQWYLPTINNARKLGVL